MKKGSKVVKVVTDMKCKTPGCGKSATQGYCTDCQANSVKKGK